VRGVVRKKIQIIGKTPSSTAMWEADLVEIEPGPLSRWPKLLEGKFVDFDVGEAVRYGLLAGDVNAGFEGKPYRLKLLDREGNFRLAMNYA
jgi:hypothetical protein